MKTSEVAKEAGFNTLEEMAKVSTKTPQTLRNLHKKEPEFFKVIVRGCIMTRASEVIK